MPRLKCKKCGNIFEISKTSAAAQGLLVHVGPYQLIKCPACGKRSLMNIFSSVKEPITWPPEEAKQQQATPHELSEEEQENKRIEESKYEKAQS
jgi:DNA-directed RNA polymerase subunit RPC12/RpoP